MSEYDAPKDEADTYLIANRGAVGNCLSFWCPNGAGYTCELEKAGRYTRADAERQALSRPDIDRAIPLTLARKAAVTHVRADHLHDLMPAPPNKPVPAPPKKGEGRRRYNGETE